MYIREHSAYYAQAGKLFTAFQRLHPSSQFPGTGIGLASVRQIVERHGGLVRATGATGEGATFSFTLPAVNPVPSDENPATHPLAERDRDAHDPARLVTCRGKTGSTP